jgi:NAD(P)-dependent dehydrogenase (short-subunit alcohol dehydrogenase family)
MAPEEARVTIVTGASKGLGRGIARAFGARGMTVFTGRNTDGSLDAAARKVDRSGAMAFRSPATIGTTIKSQHV